MFQIVKTIFGIACPTFHVEFWGNIANKSHHISNIYIITSNPWPRANKARRMELLKVGSARRPLRCGQGTQTEIGTFFFLVPSFPVTWTGYDGFIFFKKSRCFQFSFEMTCEASHRVVYHPGNKLIIRYRKSTMCRSVRMVNHGFSISMLFHWRTTKHQQFFWAPTEQLRFGTPKACEGLRFEKCSQAVLFCCKICYHYTVA